MKGKLSLGGIRNLLVPRPDDPDRLDAEAIPARVLFGPAPKPAGDQRGDDLVGFLKQTYLFEDLNHGELTRLARIVHERTYRDGEYISEQGKPGAALFVLRNGVVIRLHSKTQGAELNASAELVSIKLDGGAQ